MKLSSYYYKHLSNQLTKEQQKQYANLSLRKRLGLSVALEDFLALAKSVTGVKEEPLFILHLASKTLPPGHGILGLLVQSCETLGEACALGYKFQRLTRSSMHSQLEYSQRQVASTLDLELNDPDEMAFLSEYCQGSLVAIANYLTNAVQSHNQHDSGKRIIPQAVYFAHKPLAPIHEYAKVLGTDNIHFSQPENKMVFAREIMEREIERADSGAKQVLLNEAQVQLKSLKSEASIVDDIRSQLLKQTPFKALTLVECAELMNVSASTLKRSLALEDANYKSILECVRKEQALSILKDDSVSIQEVSNRLGYSDRSAFARSFRSWMGISPLKYRQSLED